MKSLLVENLTKEFTLANTKTRFTALNNVNFDVERGEIFGIIGSNGAGKSTLLKILARVLRPTSGHIELHGRLGSLLEVGTGFHPELTGRENIFLNAALLGMNKAEILRKFDAIVVFAGIESHLDEPVKHYSSGMYMRLAFSVAAHVQPEILLMDEVLAVGDVDFQRKCFDLIERNRKHGQTVLLVSHDIHSILRLCSRALFLQNGRVASLGSSNDVAAEYLAISGGSQSERRFPVVADAPGDDTARLRGIRIRAVDSTTLSSVDIGQSFGVEIDFDVLNSNITLFPSLTVNNEWGPICWTTDVSTSWHGRQRPVGKYLVVVWFPKNFITAGRMSITVSIHSSQPHVRHIHEQNVISFQAFETAGGSRGGYSGHIDGGIRPFLQWDVKHTKLAY
jgi:lipopolysaccharide transport system ATP-binding protein